MAEPNDRIPERGGANQPDPERARAAEELQNGLDPRVEEAYRGTANEDLYGEPDDFRQKAPVARTGDEAPAPDMDLPAADTTPDEPPMREEALELEREEERAEPDKGMAALLNRRSRQGTYAAQAAAKGRGSKARTATRAKATPRTRMVPLPSDGIVPERDLHQTPVLECRHLGIDFGGLHAVEDFNLIVGKTEIAGLIGPNGAGKTTVFNLLTKVYQPTRGTILLDGVDTHGMSTPKVAQAGIARTFQNIRLFANLTVEENVAIGLHNQVRCGMWSSIFRLPKFWVSEHEFHKQALELLDIFSMADLADVTAGNLPYGAQRRLEIIRALATHPKLLLLDEPAAGMNPVETEELMTNIRKIRDDFQIAVMLIEHDMDLVMNICEGIAVLNYGKVIAKGTPEEIQGNQQVIEAYLGSSAGEA